MIKTLMNIIFKLWNLHKLTYFYVLKSLIYDA